MSDYYEKREHELSYSIAKHVLTSGLAYQRWLTTPDPETDALRVGRAIDLAFLTPEEYASSVVVAPKCDRRTKEGKAAWAEFLLATEGKIVLTDAEGHMLDGMRDSLELPCHASVKALLTDGEKQREFHWVDPETGIQCKGRADNIVDVFGDPLIVDLKSTIDVPTQAKWRSVVHRYDYQLQAAAYFDAMEAAGTPATAFAWVCAEKSPPYHWVAWFCRPSDIQYGFERWREALRRMKEWKETGVYPSIVGGDLYQENYGNK